MRMKLAVVCSAVALSSAGVATLASRAQERPGQATQARVWVENRGPTEAVPVSLQEVAASKPISVQLVGSPIVAIARDSQVQARFIRQTWEYRGVLVRADQDMASALAPAGMEGWEATSVQASNPSGIIVLLKRPR